MPHPTEPNTARVDWLLEAHWPASPDQLDQWIGGIDPEPSEGSNRAGMGAIEPDIHRGRLAGVYWSANYPGDADLLEAYHQLSSFVTERLGDPVDEQVHPVYGAARLWRTPEFTVETYAHVQRTDPPTIAALQIHVDLTGPADARNAEDEKRERERQEHEQR